MPSAKRLSKFKDGLRFPFSSLHISAWLIPVLSANSLCVKFWDLHLQAFLSAILCKISFIPPFYQQNHDDIFLPARFLILESSEFFDKPICQYDFLSNIKKIQNSWYITSDFCSYFKYPIINIFTIWLSERISLSSSMPIMPYIRAIIFLFRLRINSSAE